MHRQPTLKLTHLFIAAVALGTMLVSQPRTAAAAAPAARASQTCDPAGYWLPSMSILRLVHNDGTVVDLKRDIRNHMYMVHVAVDGQYQGVYYVPTDIGPIQVRMELRLMTEPDPNGQIRQVYKEKPIVRACSDWTAYTISS